MTSPKPLMSLSLPEISALCTRAARGSGFSWGQSEECGGAATWLASNGCDWAAIILNRLTGVNGGTITPNPSHWATTDPICGLRAGMALTDFASLPEGPNKQGVALGIVLTPAIVLPFAAHAAKALETTLKMSVDDVPWATVSALGLHIYTDQHTLPDQGAVRLDHAPHITAVVPAQRSGTITPVQYAKLDALALQMTVPSSAQSEKGAGAD